MRRRRKPAASGITALNDHPDPFTLWSLPYEKLRQPDLPDGTPQFVHPADLELVDELFDRHRATLCTFPSPFLGPLKTAKVVLAYAGPGDTDEGEANDRTDALDRKWVDQRLASFDGETPIDPVMLHGAAWNWMESRLASVLGESPGTCLNRFKSSVALVDLTAYRGRNVTWAELAFLETTQAMRAWARRVLFAEARREERVVIVMRAHVWWGLKPPSWSKGLLFCPAVNRSGYMLRDCEVGKAAKQAARGILGLGISATSPISR